MRRPRAVRSPVDRSAFAGFRFPPEVITVAVRWYLRYGLSYRDVEELLAERGIDVDHVTIYRWVQRFTPLFADAARPLRHATGDRWFVDETYVKVAGRWRYLYRAVDQYGPVRWLGEYEHARLLDEDTLTRRRRVLGEDHLGTLYSATNLAVDLRRLGQHEQARRLDEDTLTRRRRLLGDDHPDTLQCGPCRAACSETGR